MISELNLSARLRLNSVFPTPVGPSSIISVFCICRSRLSGQIYNFIVKRQSHGFSCHAFHLGEEESTHYTTSVKPKIKVQ